MNQPLLRRFAIVVLFCGATTLWGQQPDPLEEAKQTVRDALLRIVVPTSRLTNGPHVRATFREVVDAPRRATVRIRCNGRDVALGAIVGADGQIVTKASVLDGSIQCRLHDGREFDARRLAEQADFDLALLQIDATELPVVQWGNAVAAGQWIAVPGPAVDPVAVGVVGAGPRKIGRRSGVLGVVLDVTEDGPRVVRVLAGSGAANAGLQVNDVLTHCNGQRTTSREQLIRQIRRFGPGEEIELTFVRDGTPKRIKARLTETVEGILPARSDIQNAIGTKVSRRRFGFPAALQHDAGITPAECGGPLVDLDGRTVALNIARAGRTSTLAIPADVLQKQIEKMTSTVR